MPHGSQRRVEMPSGSLLLLYTDGLIERRTAPIADGLEHLLGRGRRGQPDAVCDDVIAAMVGDDEPADDVAVLAARAAPDPLGFGATLRAEQASG